MGRYPGQNLNGTLRSCQIFGQAHAERGYGRIVNIASLASFVALTEVAAYSPARQLLSLDPLAAAVVKKGVTVNAIAPVSSAPL